MNTNTVDNKPDILIVGVGAIGSFYGAILKKAGCSVSLVLRSDYEAVKAQGVRIESPLGDLSFTPDRIYREGDAPEAPPDFLILCVKVLPGIDRAAIVAPWMGEKTRLVLIENGLDIEKELADAYPDNPLISCLAFAAVNRLSSGVVEHKAFGKLVFGLYPQGVNEDCQVLAQLFQDGGINIELTERVVGERWRKCLWNTPFNPLSVIANGADTRTLVDTDGGEELMRAMMREVMEVAAANGYLMDESLIDKNIETTRKMPAYKNSMAQDYLNGRPIERDAVLGNVVAIAKRHGVPVPHLNTVLVTLKMRAVLEGRD